MRIEIVPGEVPGYGSMICPCVVGDWGLYRLGVVRCISGRMPFQLESGEWNRGMAGEGGGERSEESW